MSSPGDPIIQATVGRLKADAALVAALVGGIHTQWSTKGEFPRLVLDFDGLSITGSPMRGGAVEMDVFDQGNDIGRAARIGRGLISLFDGEVLNTDDTGPTLRYYLQGNGPVRDPDPQVTRYRVSFSLRFLPVNHHAGE